ncbi:MAG TPA: hypothetical protein VG889_09810 [Rhizomicrobium sp.]|nr:hypothetical protein [Rhizomicrobium sp.]
MSDPAFVKQATTDPFFVLSTTGEAANAPDFTWLFQPAAANPNLSLTPQQSFALSGLYVLIDRPVADQALFDAQLQALLPGVGTQNLRFLWIATNGAPAPQDWQLLPLRAGATNSSTGIAVLSAPFVISYNGGYTLQIANQAQLTVSATAFSFAGRTPVALFGYGGRSQTVAPPVSLALGGAAVGCFGFALSMTRPGQGPSDFEALALELRYFAPNYDTPRDGEVHTFRYKVFAQPSTTVAFNGVFDPLGPLTPSRTYLQFAGTPPTLPCMFVSTTGQALNALPSVSPTAPLLPARLVFAASLTHATPNAADPYYMCPAGAYGIAPAVAAGDTFSLMCGTSGAESLLLKASGSLLHFAPGNAYAPNLVLPTGLGIERDYIVESLTATATTAWVYAVNAAAAPVYFAQPNEALLYGTPPTPIGADDALGFQPVPAGTLPATPTPFPMAPYTAIDGPSSDLFEQLERSALSPSRRNVIAALTIAAPAAAGDDEDDNDKLVTTPNGIFVTLDSTLSVWKAVIFGNSPAADSPDKVARTFGFQNVSGGFKAAIQTNRLFAVIADREAIDADADTTYSLNQDAVVVLLRRAVLSGDDDLARLVAEAAERIGGGAPQTFSSFADLFAQVEAIDLEGVTPSDYADAFADATVDGDLCIEKWTFKLAPGTWRDDTVMLLKFVNRSIDDLVGDPGAWTWPEAAARKDRTLQDTQAQLRQIIADARAAVAATPPERVSPYKAFLDDIIDNPAWTGTLFFNAAVPPTSLPKQLQGLAAGIDFAKFKAHHFAICTTPIEVSDGEIATQPSSLTALIDYQDPSDQYVDRKVDYAFKVTVLQVQFRNSAIVNFASEIQLQVNKLFSVPVLLSPSERGNNVVLAGTYQTTEDGSGYYDYAQSGSNRFAANSNVLDEVETLSCHYVSLDPQTVGGKTVIGSRFEFAGRLRFFELDYFDAFSFGPVLDKETGEQTADGYLSFGNMIVSMSFAEDAPQEAVFAFDAGALSFNMAQSIARPMSLFRHFPLTLNGLVAVPQLAIEAGTPKAVTPGSLGYIECSTPLQPGRPNPPWYGLAFNLDLGSLGSLAGNQKLGAGVIAAWGNGGDGYNVYIGLKLPGSNSAKPEIPIEGLLKLAFGKVEFTASDDAGGRAYMLKLRQIVLRILLLSFPPGNVDLYLFGDPAARASNSALGWYAAYSRAE